MMFDDISQAEDAVRQDLINIEGLKAFISVPLRAKRNVMGVLNIASRSPSKFSTADMFFLQSVGDQLGLAIEQAKLYDQLRSGRERYRKLSHLMILAQEDERRKIAGSLGDITSRSLSSIALNLQALVEMAQEIDINDEEFKSKLEKTHSMTVDVGNEVNRLIADLRPTFMDTLELVPAIRHYAETNLIPLGIDVAFDFDDGETSLPPELATRLFRITQGVIGNIQQHSQATKVSISLKIVNDELILYISDNGKGFDVRRLSHIEENGRGAGLFGMKEKTRLLGGRCSIESKDGQGTNITAIIPLQ
jgi:signal transduction histidine kinase